MYPNVELHIGGAWRGASGGGTLPVLNPATAEPIGTHPVATREDLDAALEAAKRGFKAWKATSVYDRYKIMRKAADLLRERAETIAKIMTLEQGKPLPEAKMEVLGGADTIDWFAEEGRRAYGRVIPGRAEGVMQIVIREPVGPVAAFTPWNFPINQAVRKVSARALHRLLGDPQRPRGHAGELHGARARLPRRRRARRAPSASSSATRRRSRNTSSPIR